MFSFAAVAPARRGLLRGLVSRVHQSKSLVGCVRHFSLESKVNASIFDRSNEFLQRHIGPSPQDVAKMLDTTGLESMESLVRKTIPASILTETDPLLQAKSEVDALAEFETIMSKNIQANSYIGNGYNGTVTPGVIARNILENPAWYTSYTPYQAEISQGRLEMLLNFQTLVTDLTGLPIANASLLDEATAAAEAMYTMYANSKRGADVDTFLISDKCHPQTIAVVRTRAKGFGVTVKVQPAAEFDLTDPKVFGICLQYPGTDGLVVNYQELVATANEQKIRVGVAADILALTVLTPPGEWGADIVFGSAQRFGVSMGYGGPHAAYFAAKEELKRKIPGRIIGVSKDAYGEPALRMALQTREQHIRRDKASSNICTAQALLANMSAAYAIYHGPQGLKEIAQRVHGLAKTFSAGLSAMGLNYKAGEFFDTVQVQVEGNAEAYCQAAAAKDINFRMLNADNFQLSFDETHDLADIDELFGIFAEVSGSTAPVAQDLAAASDLTISPELQRESQYLAHPVFNSYHSETEMLRYLYHLQTKDLSLATAMIPLGSCTMKLNATSEMIPVTWGSVANIHPFAPKSQVKGYKEMLDQMDAVLSKITGFHRMSLQPNAGSQGEYTGLQVIQAYHDANGQGHRDICFVPTSAHGTNPASAKMLGLKRVVIESTPAGDIDIEDLRAKTALYGDRLSNIMITYPSTHGVFEQEIVEIIKIVHDAGGQVYMDGANMNAQVGLCSPGEIGADVCHLNLHKTFCIPHGGGGPGMGPIGVAEHLTPFLPSHPYALEAPNKHSTGAIAAAPYSSASILPITWMYIKMMGGAGLKYATEVAILSANYMSHRLKEHYDVLYTGENGTCAHEFILDIRPLKKSSGVVAEDIAKRLMDYNFHAPTMSFPVAGTLMIEPTESESLYELDRFCDAMISIRKEIKEVEDGLYPKNDNVLKNSPHTAPVVISADWNHAYTVEKAAYPMTYLRSNKYWPTVSRLNNPHGDKNLMCSCPELPANLNEAEVDVRKTFG